MPTITTRPDGVHTATMIQVYNGGSADAVLRDDNDITYVQFADAFSSSLVLAFADPAIPPGGVMRSVNGQVRWATWSGAAAAAGLNFTVGYGTASVGTIPGITDPGAVNVTTTSGGPVYNWTNSVNTPNLAQGYLNGMSLILAPYSGSTFARIFEAYLNYVYAAPPSAPAVTGPTGTLTVNNPTVTWVHQPGADAVSGQDYYRVRVYDTANPSVIVWDSGNVAGAATSQVVGPLTLEHTYRAVVNTMQTTNGVGQWSPDGSTTFTLSVTGPTAAVTAPANNAVVGTTSPTVTWTHTPGAGAQTGQTYYRIRAFVSTNLTDPAYDTGPVASSAKTAVIGPLDGTVAWHVVVNTAQTTYGVLQWSPDAATNFTIDAVASQVASVVPTPDDAAGSIPLTITRDTATPLWTTIDVEASYDGGTTWTSVRGGTHLTVNGDTARITDYEAPNDTPVLYRARATRVSSGVSITGAWKLSAVTSWHLAGNDVWIKDPDHPERNVKVCISSLPQAVYDRTVGVFRPVGAHYPVVVSDVLQAPTLTASVQTATRAEAEAFLTIVSAPVLLVQSPALPWGWGSRYVAPGAVTESRTGPVSTKGVRIFAIAMTEVARPADEGAT